MPNAVRSCLANSAGVLLAGGKSHRFGAEKAVALFRGRPLMDVVADRFAGLARVAVSARPGSAAAAHARTLGLTVLHDDPTGACGPLAGVLAGLRWTEGNGHDVLATAPCDAPLLPLDLFARLIESLGAAPAAFAVTARGEHPLCAAWTVGLLPPLEDALSDGAHPAVRGFLAREGAVGVHFDNADAFANVNTANALAALERVA